jgi:hypothetical protein
VTGTIPVPSILGSPDAQTAGGLWTRDVCILKIAGVGNTWSNGAYMIDRQYDHTQAVNASMNCYCPGLRGTYLLDSVVTRTGPMTAKQPNDVVLGAPVANTATGTIYTQLGAISKRVTDLAPVINSPFALQYIKDTTSPRRYIFPSDRGYPNTHPPKSVAYALSTGVDCMAKIYSGTSYTSSVSGETISAGYYIFATTGNQEDTPTGSVTVTFHINDPLATSITVIGEARTINFDSGAGTSDVVFHDTFNFCWTVHCYKVNH